ncbi:MAG TPA: tRNA 2-thiouridine(34) synthase MnmA [Bacteroidota bacterium]|nr:tRNA 2-thiouridine(34) synthase MnmA [Bacteroidota bacterium]
MSTSPKNTTVVVGMSGGVDSSVAAGLLVEQGYNVIGLTIKTFNYDEVGGSEENEKSCCSLDGINDARMVAAKLGIPHYVVDFSEQFGREVIDNFVDEYLRGRTPNPCVICNRKIKWEELIGKSVKLGADYIATGHYAQVRRDDTTGRYVISRGSDLRKDQSYALWGLTQESLRRTMFPLSGMTKDDARAVAGKLGLRTAAKGESFEICFVTDNNYERFLKHRVPSLASSVDGGDIVMDGKVIGKHRGYPFYTVGQRKGIGVALPEPVYVTGINYKDNVITVGEEQGLLHRSLVARKLNLIKFEELRAGMRLTVKIRYKDIDEAATVTQLDGPGTGEGSVEVQFDEPKRAITPGQSVVFYDGEDLVGGAVIESASN